MDNFGIGTHHFAAVPEPAGAGLGLGLIGLGVLAWRGVVRARPRSPEA